MARIRLIEDDPSQLEIRTLLLEAQGHEIVDSPADLILMDLRIPTLEDGLAYIRDSRRETPPPKLIVLSGYTADFRTKEEAHMVDAILEKPCPTGKLLKTIQALLALFLFILPLQAAPPTDLKRHAPILFERADAIGTNSDLPLLMYCEWDEPERSLTYTVIFSNEDGGTSTRSLMARWGRTTDIEYVYKVWLNENGTVTRREIQGPGHKDISFEGPFEGDRPLLVPVTRNNMVAAAINPKGKRFDLTPSLVDLKDHSREYVMDLNPTTWTAAREELIRENKLRPYGTIRGEDISDPRNYAYIEFKATQRDAARIAIGARTRNMNRLHLSHLGLGGNMVERSGWMRLALELPPGSRLEDISEVTFACYNKGACLLEKFGFIELNGRRGQIRFDVPQEILAGQQWSSTLK